MLGKYLVQEKSMHTKFLTWWLVVTLQAILFGISFHFGSYEYLLNNDLTKLSFLIILIWIVTSFVIGYKSFNNSNDYSKTWFISDACMTLGMIGTVIGFMLMLGSSFENIDPANTAQTKQVISYMAQGMSTALLTTLIGLIASLFLKIQLIVAEKANVET